MEEMLDEEKLKIVDNAIKGFQGNATQLESAIGFFWLGFHFGWKFMYLAHSKKTVRQYEEILDIKIRDCFPEKGIGAERSTGFRVVQTMSNFWKAISSGNPEVKTPNIDRAIEDT